MFGFVISRDTDTDTELAAYPRVAWAPASEYEPEFEVEHDRAFHLPSIVRVRDRGRVYGGRSSLSLRLR